MSGIPKRERASRFIWTPDDIVDLEPSEDPNDLMEEAIRIAEEEDEDE